MSLARGPGPLSCKTATQISNPRFDCHSTGMGMVTVACRDAKSNRVESMFPAALLRCKCIHPSSSSPLPSFFILRALSFHPSPIDRNILFLLREREREGGILGCIRHLPYPRHRRAKMVKRGEKGVEVDVGAGNAHAYDRRREMLVTVWIISNRPLTFSPICNSTRIFRAQPGIESNGYTDARFHSSVTFHSFRVLPCPLLFSSSTTSYSGILIIRKSYPRNGWKVGWAVGKPPLSRIRFTLVVRRFFSGIATTGVNQNLTFDRPRSIIKIRSILLKKSHVFSLVEYSHKKKKKKKETLESINHSRNEISPVEM